MKNYRGTYKYGGRTSLYVSHHNPLGFTAALPAYTGQRSSPHSMCFYFWCNFKTSSVAPDKQSSHGLNRVELATFVFCFKFLCQFFFIPSPCTTFSLFSHGFFHPSYICFLPNLQRTPPRAKYHPAQNALNTSVGSRPSLCVLTQHHLSLHYKTCVACKHMSLCLPLHHSHGGGGGESRTSR